MAITMLEIARRVNVSQATVSRVLSGKPSQFISEGTRSKVLQAANELGYQMNRAARSLATGKTQVVGLWIRNPDRPYYSQMVRALHDLARADGYETILSAFVQQPDPPAGIPEMPHTRPIVAGWPVDGIIAADCAKAAREHIAHEHSENNGTKHTPLVGLSSDYPLDADYIGCDHETGCEEAVRHLLERGCRRIAHVTANGSISPVRSQRTRAYERVLQEAGLPVDLIVAPEETRSGARDAVKQRFKRGTPPDALFCINDDLAIGAYRGVRDLGLRVPEDVAIVGIDGIEDGEYTDPAISTVVQPVEAMCKLAWATLQDRMSHPEMPLKQVRLPAKLVIRGSSMR